MAQELKTNELSKEEQKKYNEIFQKLSQKFKGPILNLQTQCSQVIPNVIDQLIQNCVELSVKLDRAIIEKQKIAEVLAKLQTASKPK